MEINEEIINDRYKNNIFINSPDYESKIKILHKQNINSTETPFFSIVIPINNQENIIIKNLNSILDKTSEESYELIIIIDCCSDNTEKYIYNWVKNIEFQKYSLLTNILVLRSEIPLFETSADNLGFFCSNGKYCLEIQADMEMTDYGYNMKLLKPFLLDNKIIGISGRCCHSFIYNEETGVGKLGRYITKKLNELPSIDVNAYYIGETCNRGPLLLDNEKLKEMKYLDEVNYFLDNSDHDLFARAFVEKSWICGYVPIDFNSPLENGSTRKLRDNLNKKYYNLKLKTTKNGKNGFLINNIKTIPNRDIIKISY
jgi:hypothetical protein